MPRKAPDNTQELRVTLGNLERAYAKELLRTSQANVLSKTVTGIAAGVGGVGVLVGALAFASWKAPGVISNAAGDAWDVTQDALGIRVFRGEDGTLNVAPGIGGFAGIGGVLDMTFNASSDGLVALRREGQALAVERGIVSREINGFCTINADSYDQAKCSAAHMRKDAYFAALADYRRRVAEWAEQTGKDDSSVYGGEGSALGSLGDIDPNYQS